MAGLSAANIGGYTGTNQRKGNPMTNGNAAPVMRAKMKVVSVSPVGPDSERLTLAAVAKLDGYGPDGADEDNTFAKFTPQATVDMIVANPALKGKIAPGEVYYLDFTRSTGA